MSVSPAFPGWNKTKVMQSCDSILPFCILRNPQRACKKFCCQRATSSYQCFPRNWTPIPSLSLEEPWVLRRTRQLSSPQGNRETDCLTPRRGSNMQGVGRGFSWVRRDTAGLKQDAPSSFSLPPSPASSLFRVRTEKLIYQTPSSKAGVGFPSLRVPSPPTFCPPQIHLWGSVGLSQAHSEKIRCISLSGSPH